MSNVRHLVEEPLDTRIKTIGDVLQWAREHPRFFFSDGVVSEESLVEQVVDGSRALGVADVEVHHLRGWLVVAAREDWFHRARFPIPEDFNFHALTPFPELGANCIRPECVIAAFAERVVVRGPLGVNVVKGSVAPDDPILVHLAEVPSWQRAVAFEGVAGA